MGLINLFKWSIAWTLLRGGVIALQQTYLIRKSLTTFAAAVGLFSSTLVPAVLATSHADKLTNLPSAEIAKIVSEDITNRQALVTADFTRAIYNENCLFQDEIDTYPMDKYVKGTSALFNAATSHVGLVGDVTATADEISFRFQETLVFNVPFQPKVQLSGKVKLTRGKDGLIEYSREFWDNTPGDVLKTVTFN